MALRQTSLMSDAHRKISNIPTNAKPSVETASVGIQKNKTLKVGLLRLAAKNGQNSNPAMIQNRGERRFAMDMR
jgi:hypothetical protein